MSWNPRIIQNNRSIFGESLELFIKFTGRLAECRFRPLHTESALMLELQPIQINFNGGIKNHASGGGGGGGADTKLCPL